MFASLAAATVPEYKTSVEMFNPSFNPEITKSKLCSKRATPNLTQSAGKPPTAIVFSELGIKTFSSTSIRLDIVIE